MSAYVDFDRMIAEMRGETATFRVFGEDVVFRRSVPALAVLELMRLDEEGGVPPDVLVRVAGAVFGSETVEAWTGRGDFTLDMLAELLKAALNLIAGEPLDARLEVTEDDQGGPEKN